METRNLEITLSKAQNWYKSGIPELKDVALQVFTEKELDFDFEKIKTFNDALNALDYDEMYKYSIYSAIESMNEISQESAAMFKLKIIRMALNHGFDLHYTDYAGNEIWHPTIVYVKYNCNYIKPSTRDRKIGEFTYNGSTYEAFRDCGCCDYIYGLNQLEGNMEIGDVSRVDLNLFGCANEAIAKHFSKYFGMLMIEAMYGDLDGLGYENSRWKQLNKQKMREAIISPKELIFL